MKTQFRLLAEENTYDENGITPIRVRPIVDLRGNVICKVNIHYPDLATRDECERRASLILTALEERS